MDSPSWPRRHPTPSETILDVLQGLREHVDCRFRELSERLDREFHAIGAQLHAIKTTEEKTMSALTDLQQADQALQAEVAAFLTDIAGRLGSVDDASAEAVVADINAEVQALQGGDPANQPSA